MQNVPLDNYDESPKAVITSQARAELVPDITPPSDEKMVSPMELMPSSMKSQPAQLKSGPAPRVKAPSGQSSRNPSFAGTMGTVPTLPVERARIKPYQVNKASYEVQNDTLNRDLEQEENNPNIFNAPNERAALPSPKSLAVKSRPKPVGPSEDEDDLLFLGRA